MNLSERLTGWALASSGMGLMIAAVLPDWWLSWLTLLTLACILLAGAIAARQGK